jgi:hypothetical protein
MKRRKETMKGFFQSFQKNEEFRDIIATINPDLVNKLISNSKQYVP